MPDELAGDGRCERAIARFDAANSQDPNQEITEPGRRLSKITRGDIHTEGNCLPEKLVVMLVGRQVLQCSFEEMTIDKDIEFPRRPAVQRASLVQRSLHVLVGRMGHPRQSLDALRYHLANQEPSLTRERALEGVEFLAHVVQVRHRK